MAEYRKEVTGSAEAYKNTYTDTPSGGTAKGPGKSGDINSQRFLKPATGYYDENGTVDTYDYGMTKGPENQALGATGVSKSGGGKGRF